MFIFAKAYQWNVCFSRSMSMDHSKPLIVPAGADALGQIGLFGFVFNMFGLCVIICLQQLFCLCGVSVFVHLSVLLCMHYILSVWYIHIHM